MQGYAPWEDKPEGRLQPRWCQNRGSEWGEGPWSDIWSAVISFCINASKVVTGVNSRLGLINRHFRHIETKPFTNLYKTLLRPNVEYCTTVAQSVYKKDKGKIDLTRFNKIAIQGTPQMAVDKEALICLSRVYSYYFKCNFPLFYVYPALTRYLSILFLNILTLLACTHSSDNVFHTLMVLCENENFLTSNLLCFFTRVKLWPLVILLSLIWKKKRLESIFS